MVLPAESQGLKTNRKNRTNRLCEVLGATSDCYQLSRKCEETCCDVMRIAMNTRARDAVTRHDQNEAPESPAPRYLKTVACLPHTLENESPKSCKVLKLRIVPWFFELLQAGRHRLVRLLAALLASAPDGLVRASASTSTLLALAPSALVRGHCGQMPTPRTPCIGPAWRLTRPLKHYSKSAGPHSGWGSASCSCVCTRVWGSASWSCVYTHAWSSASCP